ncbi:helix-turn-helix transcriptional regulator [Ktedonobacter racemifer]|uniref:Helix-turn-helix domain protein n=1 Tax=Ktedonobacter racemifer DSM 44963 TaxID=485913 RepID=D6U5L4_KTERA|nr:helix-turn-helix transcriptional regulator [Ktedonobacter racemifer]EFH80275.1 helix-turn-helix domain protein [Ktedonobacter racemifer DSM 44963]
MEELSEKKKLSTLQPTGTFPNNLDRFICHLGLQKAQLAKELGVSPGTLSHYISGRRAVPDDRRIQFSKLLKQSVDDIFPAPKALPASDKQQLQAEGDLYASQAMVLSGSYHQLKNVHQQQILAFPPFLESNSSVSHSSVGMPSTLHTVSRFETMTPETLEQLASLTVHCQHLSEGNELGTAEQVLWSYLPRVEDVVKFSFDSQQRAAEIASQGYLLAASLAGHRSNLWERKYRSEQALLYGKLAGNISLQMVALRQLAITFDCLQRPDLVLHISEQTFSHFRDVSPLLRACIYAGVSGAYAQLGQQQDALRFMERAYEHFPTNVDSEPYYLHTICRYSTLVFFDGLNYLEMNQPRKAEEILGSIDGLHPKIQIPERVRIELLKYQVEVFLALNSMEQACVYLEAAAKASLVIGSQRHFQESFHLFLQMQQKWKMEPQIQQLADLFLRERLLNQTKSL